jgi:hypothetical protein
MSGTSERRSGTEYVPSPWSVEVEEGFGVHGVAASATLPVDTRAVLNNTAATPPDPAAGRGLNVDMTTLQKRE